ncbi:MAG: excinuclease ABC subunit UvrB [Acidobacteria bacterium]|nr:excinuclease ABC subunit UvrB [Acidobacteriota bacterium]
MDRFQLVSNFTPQGDQPSAIEELVNNLNENTHKQVLLGVTGSGKTYTMAKVIETVNRPALVIAHNKTLAAQLFEEFRNFFPNNAVEYFVSYYDYYQPEAYVPARDLYIEKEMSLNQEIDRLRHSATRSLFERRDVIIVASVSCIYGLGSPQDYFGMVSRYSINEDVDRQELLRRFVDMQYERNDTDFRRGTFRVRGDVVEIVPAYSETAIRFELFGDEIEKISEIDPLRGTVLKKLDQVVILPKSHYVVDESTMNRAIKTIEAELQERLEVLQDEGKLVEAHRLGQRTKFDMEMLREVGYCTGIENYSRHLTGRSPGEPPPCLLDYLPDDSVTFIDESHQTVPQIRGMYNGDQSRKKVLVDHGFRMPSAMDNRPLNFTEFEERTGATIYVSATPGPYELGETGGVVTEQIIRPTGLIDPPIIIRPIAGQVDDLYSEIQEQIKIGGRTLVTTLTKRMAEELTAYFRDMGLKVRYMHSDINTLDRIVIIQELRSGKIDVLIGINLLREGLDIPEVTFVAILDADKEGFLRSSISLIQTVGRAARNVNSKVIFYADNMTKSMRECIDETERRRNRQLQFNEEHDITPQSIKKGLVSDLSKIYQLDYFRLPDAAEAEPDKDLKPGLTLEQNLKELEEKMFEAARDLEFEEAAQLRDKIKAIREKQLFDPRFDSEE